MKNISSDEDEQVQQKLCEAKKCAKYGRLSDASKKIRAMSDIEDAPICVQDREELYGALKQETVILRCSVDAHPPVVAFHWTFNNSGDQSDVSPDKFTSEVTSSRLNYTPATDLDYGTLLCYGENEIGRQKDPCVFQVVVAGE
ncbi:unnamed protein product [Diabrotica balteata]|uniref:Ig-like domain-containing protein n=1 Tax=Diabrotica balteata TaxID=107213 RepID=A0A9N9T860_DIABA|nr:unnamed protein product [Diabrotica balteata]